MNPQPSRRAWSPLYSFPVIALLTCRAVAQNLAGDEALSKVLINGEDWQLVADGFGFTDAACADGMGNFYFYDLGKGTGIRKISADGKVTTFIDNTPKCSGLKFGPDGRLYACTQEPKKQVVAFEVPSGKITVLADDVQPNDLIVSHEGFVYFTETGKGQVTIVDAKGSVRTGATGINKPNGITLSPDQGTLAVSEYGGTNVWVFRVERDGSLTAGERYMTLRRPVGKPDSGGDGMTTDALGRYYVTSHVGIQMFDWTGRLGGVIARPQNKGTVSVAFAGPDLEYLYACSSDKIYRRRTKAKGAWLFRAPAKQAGKAPLVP
ncbi:MAG TPA: SMP-30/gluconolactonase/LRE family protein [Candidatus Angelobacter sp.]|nr:SMP-30/gluconolactonase/LRE family protein [Candidatus Angelobacter sp.]